MLSVRVIPVLLYNGSGLVKSVKFSQYTYVGDAINAVKIFNEKEVDELLLLDISATPRQRPPDFQLIGNIASECFMPLGYGGGITEVAQIRQIFRLGVEKASLNTAAIENPALVRQAADACGSQSIVVSIDVKRNWLGQYEVYTHGGKRRTRWQPARMAAETEKNGAGELLINSIDRDGTQQGYDVDLIRQVAGAVSIPVVACGGAGRVAHLSEAVQRGGASAVAAGSLFVFHGKHRAVLINYPERRELEAAFNQPEAVH